jgi:hypothetical protein
MACYNCLDENDDKILLSQGAEAVGLDAIHSHKNQQYRIV